MGRGTEKWRFLLHLKEGMYIADSLVATKKAP